jgi:hypothetical protein
MGVVSTMKRVSCHENALPPRLVTSCVERDRLSKRFRPRFCLTVGVEGNRKAVGQSTAPSRIGGASETIRTALLAACWESAEKEHVG